MSFRFDEDELALLRAAEHLRGADLARTSRADTLRDALTLARVFRRVGQSAPGSRTVLSEAELRLLADAVRFAASEVRWLGEVADHATATGPRDRLRIEGRRVAIETAFPNLDRRGSWRGSGLQKALERLAARLNDALGSG